MPTKTFTVSVGTGAAVLLAQTSTGVPPDPETTAQGNATPQIFMAGSFNDPLRVQVFNEDATNPIFVGGAGVTSATGVKVPAGTAYPPNGPLSVVGNDALYAISTGGTVSAVVAVGPFQ